MRVRHILGQAALLGILAAVGSGVVGEAFARPHLAGGTGHSMGHSRHGYALAHFRHGFGGGSGARFGGGLQCVPFARENTGIELAGNAANWWENAEGVYQRGARPEVGSVLNFRANGRMRMGHVAVVSGVMDGRNIEIDHANWSGRGSVGRNINVVDVSPGNDWSAVRVELGRTGEFGSVYPTYGFIYDRPDHGTMVANTGVTPSLAPTLAPTLAAAGRDLRPAAERDQLGGQEEEVAEASDEAPRYHRAWSRHGGRHEMFAARETVRGHGAFGRREAFGGREAFGSSLHGGGALRFGYRGAHEGYPGARSAHASGREVFSRPTLMRTQAHEAGAAHAHHVGRHRT